MNRMMACLSLPMRERLDALVAVAEDDPFSALNRIKATPSRASPAGMSRLLAKLGLIEETGVLEIDIDWINGNYQRFLFHSVRTMSADRLRELVAPRRYLSLVCFLRQAWRDTLDQGVDMYGKLLERDQKQAQFRLEEKLKAQRHAANRIMQHYQDLTTVLLDPDVDDAALRQELLTAVPEHDLKVDQFTLANTTVAIPYYDSGAVGNDTSALPIDADGAICSIPTPAPRRATPSRPDARANAVSSATLNTTPGPATL